MARSRIHKAKHNQGLRVLGSFKNSKRSRAATKNNKKVAKKVTKINKTESKVIASKEF